MILRSARLLILLVGGLLVATTLAAAVALRITSLRERLVATLSERLDSEVSIGSLSVGTFPLVSITGDDLVIRKKGTSGPPLISIKRFNVEGGLIGLLSKPRRFNVVHLDGLVVTIAPDQAEQADDDGRVKGPSDTHVYIHRVLAHQARLVIVPKRAGKAPKEWQIHDLELDDVGFDRALPFRARLTNPLPEGQIAVKGTFGPWRSRDPGETPLAGRYEFRNADLSTIRGIGGILSSDGEFRGILKRIDVRGTTRTPDFALDISAGPVPLETRFDATVDGTDGDTLLNKVEARFRRTSLTARGGVVGTPGVKGRTVKLAVRMDRGRIEDVLRLAVDASDPMMTGDMRLETTLLLPPGRDRPVSERLQLAGAFALSRGEFNDGEVQRKLVSLSRRSRGMDENAAATGEVVSNLRGTFRLGRGVLDFSNLTFGVPGAEVRIRGSYGLRTEAMDFLGHLRMQATVSRAMGGGVKGWLLKPFDPLFRRDGAGAVVPIRIGGTREAPKFGLDYRRVLTRR